MTRHLALSLAIFAIFAITWTLTAAVEGGVLR